MIRVNTNNQKIFLGYKLKQNIGTNATAIIAVTFILPSIIAIMYHGIWLNKFTLYNVGGAV